MRSQVGASRTLNGKPCHSPSAAGTAKPEPRRSPPEVAGGPPTLPNTGQLPTCILHPGRWASASTRPVLTLFQAMHPSPTRQGVPLR